MSEEKIEILEHRLSELENEVRMLKEQLIRQPVSTLSATGRVAPPKSQPKTPQKVVKPSGPKDWEKLIGQVWLPRIFIFVLLLGAIFAFVAAVDYGLITKPVRLVLGVLVSAGMYWVGKQQMKKKREALGLVLLGGCVTLLMITTFAAHVLYGYFNTWIDLFFNILWIAFGIYLAHRHHSEALGVFAGIGGYLIPFLLGSRDGNIWLFSLYELILYTSLLYFSLKKKYIVLFYTSTALLHAVYVFYLRQTFAEHTEALALAILVQHVFLLLVFLRKELYLKHQLTTMFGSFVFTLVWCGFAFTGKEMDGILIGFTTIYAVISSYMRKAAPERLAIPTSIASFSLMVYLLKVLGADHSSIWLLLEGCFSLCLAFKLNSNTQKVTGFLIYLIGIVLTVVFPIHVILSWETLSWVVFIGTLNVLYRFIRSQTKPDKFKRLNITISSGIVLSSFVFISELTHVFSVGLSFNVQQMCLSFSWALFSVAAVVYGILKNKRNIRIFGMMLIFITLLKLILVDLPIVSITIRAILFLGLGAIGVMMSRMFYKKN